MEIKKTFEETIQKIRDGFNDWKYHNEESVKQGIILPILQSLGWDIYDTKTVIPEYNIGGKAIDYALNYDFFKPPMVLIEAKGIDKPQIGTIFEREKAKLLDNYAGESGTKNAILTNGLQWHFFSISNREGLTLNLLDNDITEIISKFNDYLKYSKCERYGESPFEWSICKSAEKENTSLYRDLEHLKSCKLHFNGKKYEICTRNKTKDNVYSWKDIYVKICNELITEKDRDLLTQNAFFLGSKNPVFATKEQLKKLSENNFVDKTKDYQRLDKKDLYVHVKLGNNGFGKRIRMLMRYFKVPAREIYLSNIKMKASHNEKN